MEKTLENKRKFFAQYENQEIGKRSNKASIPHIVSGYFVMGHHYLELKHTKKLGDDEVLEIGKILKIKESSVIGILISDEFLNNMTNLKKGDAVNLNFADYLRSKGYALPWMGLSVEKLIEYGWIKLK